MSAEVAVIVGRWQIVQRSHVALLRAALAAAPTVVVVIGSGWHSRDSRNPFTWQERQRQFEAVLSAEERGRVRFLPVRDYSDDLRWAQAVRKGVAPVSGTAGRVVLAAFEGDDTSRYRAYLPDWPPLEVASGGDARSADLLRMYFESASTRASLAALDDYVEPAVRAYLEEWSHLPAFRQCAAEYEAVLAYRRKWTAPLSLTADSLLTAQAHVLLIHRGGDIGHGLWALPGGFLDAQERFYDAAVRELAEETGYAAPALELRNRLRGEAVFDDPFRSARGRIVSAAFHFDLGNVPPPDVRGQDDAKDARWVPIAALPAMETELFEDHALILDHFLHWFPEPARVS